MSIIFVHEIGHFLMAIYYKWETDKIYFYPYGGYSKFNSYLNNPLNEELIILLMGPIFQTIYYYVLKSLNIDCFLYHYGILIFNMLPIYPLDGGRLLNIVFSYFFSYRKSYYLTVIFSYIFLLLTFILSLSYSFNLTVVIMLMLLLYKVTEVYIKRNYYFNKFLLERFLKDFNFRKIKVINNYNNMYRDYKHVINYKGVYYREKELLTLIYNKNIN